MNTDFLTVKPADIHPRLRHADPGTGLNLLMRHRDFCLCRYPQAGVDTVHMRADGQHFQVNPIKLVNRDSISTIKYVVVRIAGNTWEVLGHSGFFNGIAPTDPRADISFAMHHRDARHFECMDDAVRAAVDAIVKEG
jgi:hypothetical protein